MKKTVAKREVSVMWRTQTAQAKPDLSAELEGVAPSVASAMLATATLTELAILLGRNAARRQYRRPGLAGPHTALVLMAVTLVAATMLLGTRLLGGH